MNLLNVGKLSSLVALYLEWLAMPHVSVRCRQGVFAWMRGNLKLEILL
jgi:hypothetical protein